MFVFALRRAEYEPKRIIYLAAKFKIRTKIKTEYISWAILFEIAASK